MGSLPGCRVTRALDPPSGWGAEVGVGKEERTETAEPGSSGHISVAWPGTDGEGRRSRGYGGQVAVVGCVGT